MHAPLGQRETTYPFPISYLTEWNYNQNYLVTPIGDLLQFPLRFAPVFCLQYLFFSTAYKKLKIPKIWPMFSLFSLFRQLFFNPNCQWPTYFKFPPRFAPISSFSFFATVHNKLRPTKVWPLFNSEWFF